MKKNLREGFETAYLDETWGGLPEYTPYFLSNDPKRGRKVLVSLEKELSQSSEFIISVAFITEAGIAPILQTLKELEAHGVKGKILTTDYYEFNQPKALRKLNDYKNIEVRMYASKKGKKGFHTKGYIFFQGEVIKTIIGSSNLTGKALSENKEWNTCMISTRHGKVIQNILTEFRELWEDSFPLNRIIGQYEKVYYKKKKRIEKPPVEIQEVEIEPNKMQKEFIKNSRIFLSRTR